jgi:1-pyrroline-5-carboxylate dehydrogenase
MSNNVPCVPCPKNEPVYSYLPGSSAKSVLKSQLDQLLREQVEVPIIIDGKEIKSGKLADCLMPHHHKHLLGKYHKGNSEHVGMAIAAATKAKKDWENMPWEHRAAIFLRAADLLATEYRPILNAATMLGQSKTVHQAEVDAACELIDFFKFNVAFMAKIYQEQPLSDRGMWNQVEYRPMEGFIFAATPFNFTSIAANLPTAPAMMGNTVVWKPASTSVYSAYFIMQLLKRAGLPSGVINMVPGPGAQIGDPALNHPDLAGVHFTGSTTVFQSMWKTIGGNIEKYKTYPRIVGETGGKDFVVAHPSANVKELATALVRGAFEYQGQKCSAASRAYIPDTIWANLKKELSEQISTIKVGDVSDFTNFMGAVIDQASFNKIKDYIEFAKSADKADVIIGGICDDSVGYFVEPTVIETTDPKFKTMEEEIFGPVLTVYVYPEKEFSKTLELCNSTSPYGLTGAIFSDDRAATLEAMNVLRHAAGNFYINDKPTGAVVGQQPFGGSRASGTNDKAGSMQNLMRWISVRTIKETFCPPTDFRYPFMQEK